MRVLFASTWPYTRSTVYVRMVYIMIDKHDFNYASFTNPTFLQTQS